MSPREMTWQAAIEKVLRDEGVALHYAEIAQRIISQKLRKKVGATPSNAVYTVMFEKKDVFEKVAPATFRLRGSGDSNGGVDDPSPGAEQASPIMALGMFWERDLVNWTGKPAILGSEQPGAAVANMTEQTGIYLLHDFRDIVYVGRATESTLGTRLSAHTRDRLKTRWNRFSWFGFRPVEENGTLGQIPNTYGLRDVVVAMEAVLIEALEPPQNRKGGDGFHGIEYIQAEDPDKAKERLISEFEHLIRRGHRG